VSEDFDIPTLEDWHSDVADTRRAEGAVRAFFQSVSVPYLPVALEQGRPAVRARPGRCRSTTPSFSPITA
jgi:hypothetical protein